VVSVGHNAVLHGCVVEDDALIGMGHNAHVYQRLIEMHRDATN
jgi:carbonic anhydrase/acetyltransferase-like protein (isoleucine patch superfamily)